jgi:heat-inducible transcriptional repressor
VSSKRPGKKERERQVLMGLVDLFIEEGKPVGSNTLKNMGFKDLSSATIRNYFMSLENDGYLVQEHSSAGRSPTNKAYRLYADMNSEECDLCDEDSSFFRDLHSQDCREINKYLQSATEQLSRASNYAIFTSSPRFDHDFITDIKLISIDQNRVLCVLITSFGLIKTDVLYTENMMKTFSLKRIEAYFHWRLTQCDEPENLTNEELLLAQKLYNEVLTRYVVTYSNFSSEEVYWTGFSHLLQYPEFSTAESLASGLSLFENSHCMRHILRECITKNNLLSWIGDELKAFSLFSDTCSVLTIPYYINKMPVGAIGILGPTRMPYKRLFAMLRYFSHTISETLTKSVYKFKIQYRQPDLSSQPFLEKEEKILIKHMEKSSPILLEDKTS